MNPHTPSLLTLPGAYDTARVAWLREAAWRALNALTARPRDRRYWSARGTEVRRRERIARKHGAEFVYAGSIPAGEVRGWVQYAYQGEPLNGSAERAVMLEVSP